MENKDLIKEIEEIKSAVKDIRLYIFLKIIITVIILSFIIAIFLKYKNELELLIR